MWYPQITINNKTNQVTYDNRVIRNIVRYYEWQPNKEYNYDQAFVFGWYCIVEFECNSLESSTLKHMSKHDAIAYLGNPGTHDYVCENYHDSNDVYADYEWRLAGMITSHMLCRACKEHYMRLLCDPIISREHLDDPFKLHTVYISSHLSINMVYRQQRSKVFPFHRMMYMYSSCKRVLMMELKVAELANEIIMYVLSGLDTPWRIIEESNTERNGVVC